jgi:thiamine-phosphate pyrophosphorylase
MRQRIDLIQSIVTQHAALALPTDAAPQAELPEDTPRGVAWAAARRLGFIPADADCIARAWQAQCERTALFDTADWPCNAPDFGLAPDPTVPAFAPCPQALGLYAVLPSADWVARMAQAGVPTLQLRFKSSDATAVRKEIEAAVQAVAGTGSLLFINDHWREAIAAGAYGVHLGQEDLDTLTPEDLATIRHAGLRLGLSTHGYAEMLRAAAVRPSYLALGAVFPTTLKAMATPPQGPARLAAYARLMRAIPLVAIGGIAQEHLGQIAASGVGAFAVVRALTAAPDPEAAAAQLMQAWSQAIATQKT